MAQKKQSGQ